VGSEVSKMGCPTKLFLTIFCLIVTTLGGKKKRMTNELSQFSERSEKLSQFIGGSQKFSQLNEGSGKPSPSPVYVLIYQDDKSKMENKAKEQSDNNSHEDPLMDPFQGQSGEPLGQTSPIIKSKLPIKFAWF
jgi:hypothetical protein